MSAPCVPTPLSALNTARSRQLLSKNISHRIPSAPDASFRRLDLSIRRWCAGASLPWQGDLRLAGGAFLTPPGAPVLPPASFGRSPPVSRGAFLAGLGRSLPASRSRRPAFLLPLRHIVSGLKIVISRIRSRSFAGANCCRPHSSKLCSRLILTYLRERAPKFTFDTRPFRVFILKKLFRMRPGRVFCRCAPLRT